jgi:hypothetical protein
MKHDKEILLVAVARCGAAIGHCFNCFDMDKADFKFLCGFASEIRSAIAIRQGVADPSSRLVCLDQGSATAEAFQRLIAEFADIPIPLLDGRMESLQAALTNMEKFGF